MTAKIRSVRRNPKVHHPLARWQWTDFHCRKESIDKPKWTDEYNRGTNSGTWVADFYRFLEVPLMKTATLPQRRASLRRIVTPRGKKGERHE